MGSCRTAIERFKEVFPEWGNRIVKWTPNKDGCIRVELEGKKFFIFTYIASSRVFISRSSAHV